MAAKQADGSALITGPGEEGIRIDGGYYCAVARAVELAFRAYHERQQEGTWYVRDGGRIRAQVTRHGVQPVNGGAQHAPAKAALAEEIEL